MRPLMSGDEAGGGTLVKKTSLTDVQAAWNLWEVHFLILLSLFLQVALFLFAGFRRHSSNSILRGLLWLAYLSADSVAIFVLGHLMVHAQESRHHLMYLWAPFVLVHLGGQDTITAFSKQDNELWRRHLLSLVTQAAVAGYVVAKASWPDAKLRAAMVIMFISGCFKYAERTLCLYVSGSQHLSSGSVGMLLHSLRDMKRLVQDKENSDEEHRDLVAESARRKMIDTLDMMSKSSSSFQRVVFVEIMTKDAPQSEVENVAIADDISGMLEEFKSRAGRCGAYRCVGACLVRCYEQLHTKAELREATFGEALPGLVWAVKRVIHRFGVFNGPFQDISMCTLLLLYSFFQYASAPLALALFVAAEKLDQHHTSRADIKVTYVLLVGAIFLGACSFLSSLRDLPYGWVKSAVSGVANCIQPAWSRKQWSEELAQYNMIKTRALLSSGNKQSIWKFGKTLPARLFGFGTITHISIAEHYTPIKEVVLDNLLCLGVRKQWDITSSHGKLALQKWMDSHQNPDSSRTSAKALEKSINLDFAISVLIWHIATEMCYFYGGNSTSGVGQANRDKQVSRELSNYIMYLVFRCGVKRTTSSQLVHDKADNEMGQIFSTMIPYNNLDEKDVVRLLLDEHKEEEQQHSTDETHKPEELGHTQDSKVTEFQKHAQQSDNNNWKKLVQSTLESLDSPVLPRAREVARELICIKHAAERWRLIVEVWSEMLYYAAPCCGGAFHYEHLTTGGEFVTHVLILMKCLGPFLPLPGT